MIDYFVVKRGNIHTHSLFDPNPGSLYYYTKGWNLKALACWVSAAAFGIPGLIGAYHPSWVSEAARHIYQTGWVVCFVVALTLYFVINLAFPAKVFPSGCEVGSKSFEGLAESEGYLDGERPITFRLSRIEGSEADSLGHDDVNSVEEVMKSDVKR